VLQLTSRPANPLFGSFTPPGDKSITHRAYLLGLAAAGTLSVAHANPGADCAATLEVTRMLGARLEGALLHGTGGRLAEPADVLGCGNSGTTLRLVAGLLAAQPFFSVLTGDASLRERPVARIIEPLRRMGAVLDAADQGRRPPLAIRGGALEAIQYAVPVASAQVVSCVLLAGLSARGRTVVELPGPARDHTERMLAAFGVPVMVESLPSGGRRVTLDGPVAIEARARSLTIPGDFSAAAFFLAAAAAREGAEVTAVGVNLNPTRTGLLDVLERMGARIARTNLHIEGGEEVGDVTVQGTRLAGIEVPAQWLPRWIDEVPAWIVAAALADGRSRITGAAELRVKESDRIASLARNLAVVGIEVMETADGLVIEGAIPRGGRVHTHGDHRLAMAFATLGGAARTPVIVEDAACIATSYPAFATDLRHLGGDLQEQEVFAA